MKNLLRALRCAWPYRRRLALSVACAVLAAVAWSLTFTSIYPILKIISNKQNLQDWVDGEITRTQHDVAISEKRLDELKKHDEQLKQLPMTRQVERELRSVAGDLAKVEGKLEPARRHLYRYRFLKEWIDRLFPNNPFQTLVVLMGLVVVGVAVKGFFDFWQESLVGSVVNRSLFDLRNRFFRNVVHLDVANFGEQGTHELMARFTNDMETLGTGTKTLFGRVVAEPLKALGFIVAACFISWQLTLLFLVLVPVALFILTKVGRLMRKATRRLLERMSSIYKLLQETFLGIRVVKAFSGEPYERRRFYAATRDYYHKAMWVVNLDALSGPIIELLGMIGIAGALLAGAYLVLSGQTHLFGLRMSEEPLEAESLLTLYAYLAAIADPVRKLSSVYARVQSGAAAADRIFNILDRRPAILVNSAGTCLDRHAKGIEFRDVCFSYEPGRPILTNINLNLRHGETVALVGRNGSGKTTLVNLLPRFADPDHGSILIDGLDIRRANLRSLRRQISIVTQDTILFDDTIFHNIAYARPRARPEDVEAAARQADVHNFISHLPHGYATRIGEAGSKLSGGQKQRLALARAILRNPSILILDEFTSQTDAESESLIHRDLRDFLRTRTTFIITHRLNTLEIADRIIVLDRGRVEAVGTHRELLANCAVYQRLHEAQLQRLVA
jgi:subfamily B ATP-binding cassette protein MsbA